MPLPSTPAPHLLVFGASGAIGSAIADAALAAGWKVTRAARKPGPGVDLAVSLDNLAPLATRAPYTAAVWAQGANGSDSLYDFSLEKHQQLYEANVTFILVTLSHLLTARLLAPAARLCIISSIWQNLARQNKLSYCVTKAALQGLVLSASADLARDGLLINAILPGALETPMTRANLAPDQLTRLTTATGHNRLATLEDVSNLALFLCGPQNTGITGQFIAADLGFSHVRFV